MSYFEAHGDEAEASRNFAAYAGIKLFLLPPLGNLWNLLLGKSVQFLKIFFKSLAEREKNMNLQGFENKMEFSKNEDIRLSW